MARIDRILLPRSASASCRSLVKLLDGDVFESELALLRVACLKTSLRFRSSHETRLLAQVSARLLEFGHYIVIVRLIDRCVDH